MISRGIVIEAGSGRSSGTDLGSGDGIASQVVEASDVRAQVVYLNACDYFGEPGPGNYSVVSDVSGTATVREIGDVLGRVGQRTSGTRSSPSLQVIEGERMHGSDNSGRRTRPEFHGDPTDIIVPWMWEAKFYWEHHERPPHLHLSIPRFRFLWSLTMKLKQRTRDCVA